MATIGTFTRGENGFSGQIKTVTLNVKTKFAPGEKENNKAPDYRIFAGQGVEFGAAWKKTSNTGREYLSVKLDDPSFPAPVFASLVAVGGGDSYALIWSAVAATDPLGLRRSSTGRDALLQRPLLRRALRATNLRWLESSFEEREILVCALEDIGLGTQVRAGQRVGGSTQVVQLKVALA